MLRDGSLPGGGSIGFTVVAAIPYLLADGLAFSVTFLKPEGLRFVLSQRSGRLGGTFSEKAPGAPGWVDRGPGGASSACGTVIEVALPLRELGVTAGAPLSFVVAVHDAYGNEVERHPTHRPVELTVPDERFDARNWTA